MCLHLCQIEPPWSLALVASVALCFISHQFLDDYGCVRKCGICEIFNSIICQSLRIILLKVFLLPQCRLFLPEQWSLEQWIFPRELRHFCFWLGLLQVRPHTHHIHHIHTHTHTHTHTIALSCYHRSRPIEYGYSWNLCAKSFIVWSALRLCEQNGQFKARC